MVSDVIRTGESAEAVSVGDWCACVAGAIREEEYVAGLREAGFIDVKILDRKPYVAPELMSATIRAAKP